MTKSILGKEEKEYSDLLSPEEREFYDSLSSEDKMWYRENSDTDFTELGKTIDKLIVDINGLTNSKKELNSILKRLREDMDYSNCYRFFLF